MTMRKIPITDLSEAMQKTLAEMADDESIVIEDANGQPRYGVIPYRRPTAAQKQPWEKLCGWQKKAEASMTKLGVTEEDVMRELLDDD